MIRCISGDPRFTGAGGRTKLCGACANRATSGHRRGRRPKYMPHTTTWPLLATDLASFGGDNSMMHVTTRPLLATDGALPHRSIALVIGKQNDLQPASRPVRQPCIAANLAPSAFRPRMRAPATRGRDAPPKKYPPHTRTWPLLAITQMRRTHVRGAASIRSVAYSPEVVAYGHAGHTPSAL